MGYDVSYHPISEQQIHDWYVTSVASDDAAAELCDRSGVDAANKMKFLGFLPQFRAIDPSLPFDRTHSFYVAVTQGFFAPYHYVRGCLLSQLGPSVEPFLKPWEEIAPSLTGDLDVRNRIEENYSGGVYVAADQVAPLLEAIVKEPAIKAAFVGQFPGKHLDVLMNALRQAQAGGLGLLEATDVIEPNPMDLNKSTSLSNLLNCDPAGALLFEETAMAQLATVGVSPGATVQRISHEDLMAGRAVPPTAEAPSEPKGRLRRFRRK